MRVLYITNYADMYGANKSLLTLMSILKENYGVEPYLLISGKKGDIGKHCDELGIKCFEYDFRIRAIPANTKNIQFRKMTRRLMRYKEFYQIYSCLKRYGLKFDLIHSNSSIFDLGLFLSNKLRVPHIWHVREYSKADYELEMIYGKTSLAKNYIKSDAVIAISDDIKEYIKKLSDQIKVKTIYNGIVLPNIYEKEYCTDNVMKFCIIGTISPHKNQLDVIKASELLIQNGYNSFQIYIVGGIGGGYYQQIVEYISEREALSNHITFTGYCDNVNEILKDKDVGIMASDMEAFGRVTIEYMANYMSVIGTNTGGTVELIKDVGILYEPHDIEALAEAMKMFIDNPNLLKKSCNDVRNRAELYDANTNAKLIYDTYLDIVKRDCFH